MTIKKFTGYGLISLVSLNSAPALSDPNELTKERRFGIPGSIASDLTAPKSQLKLSMQRVNLPKETWDDIERISKSWNFIRQNGVNAKEYINLFEQLNISSETRAQISKSREYKILFALSRPHNIYAAQLGDYDTLLSNLIFEGILTENAESALSDKIESILKTNKLLRDSLQNSLISSNDRMMTDNSDLEQLVNALNSGEVQPMSCTVAAVCLAFVAVGVAIYAAAAVNAAAVLNIGAAISIAVSVAITISGDGGGGDEDCMSCHNSVGRIEPKMIEQLALIEAFARQENMPELHTKAVIDFKRKEARSILNAALKSGLIIISDEDKKKAFNALDNLVVKSLAQ